MNYRAVVSRQRSAVMGLMAIVILLFHSEWNSPSRLYNLIINGHGNIGVDVFVFLSGFGLAHSLQKGDAFGKYCARRMERILPAYYAYLLLYLLLPLPLMIYRHSFGDVGSFLFPRLIPVGTWVNVAFSRWYVSGALGFYVIAALVYPALCKSRYVYLTTTLLLVLTAWYVPSIAEMDNAMIAIGRVPSLVVGLAVGVAAQRKERRYRRAWPGLVCLLLLCGVGTIMNLFRGASRPDLLQRLKGEEYYRIMMTLFAPMLSVALACGFQLCARLRLDFIPRCFGWLGKYSLELYLSHSLTIRALSQLALPDLTFTLATVIISIPAALLLNWIGDRLLRLWKAVLRHFVVQ